MSDEDTKSWVFVGGLPFELTEGDVICVFSQYGEVADINLVRDRETGKSRGFGFVKYEDPRSCELAVDNFSGTTIVGRRITVDYSKNAQAIKKRRPPIAPETQDDNKERDNALAMQDIRFDRGDDHAFNRADLHGGNRMLPYNQDRDGDRKVTRYNDGDHRVNRSERSPRERRRSPSVDRRAHRHRYRSRSRSSSRSRPSTRSRSRSPSRRHKKKSSHHTSRSDSSRKRKKEKKRSRSRHRSRSRSRERRSHHHHKKHSRHY